MITGTLVTLPVGGLEHLLSVAAGVSVLSHYWCSSVIKGAQMQFDKTGLEGYITDREVESDIGTWLPPFPNGRRFRIKRAGGANRKFARAFQAAIKPYKRQIDREELDPDISERILREVYARHIVVDWEGIKDTEGNEVPCTPENVEAFFAAIPEIFTEVRSYADTAATFAEQNLEEAEDSVGGT